MSVQTKAQTQVVLSRLSDTVDTLRLLWQAYLATAPSESETEAD